MHAALVNLTIAPDQAPAGANALTHDILPAIRSAPGLRCEHAYGVVGGITLAFSRLLGV
jgi:hypothetical protein